MLRRRIDRVHVFSWRRALRLGGHGLGQLHVGGIVTFTTKGNGILTGLGEYMEFVREIATNGTTVSTHRAEFQTDALKDTTVSIMHDVIGFIQ